MLPPTCPRSTGRILPGKGAAKATFLLSLALFKKVVIKKLSPVSILVNYRALKGTASHFIAKTCITDMWCSGFDSMGAAGCSIPEISMFLDAL